MDLNSDLVAIQGILVGLIKDTGEFTKINHKGGNEARILDILMEVRKFLCEKNYIKNDKINKVFEQNVENIVMFLTINTKFKHNLVLDGYAHLINIMPQLSKCILSNIVYGLDLCMCLCSVMKKLPVEITVELLDEMVICLKKSEPQVHLNYAYMFLSTASEIISKNDITKDNEDHLEDLIQVTNIILRNLTGLYSDQMKTWKATKIYKHMGYSLIKLFDLLLNCTQDNRLLQEFIENILRTCCSVIRNITIDVFCTWAEIEEDDQTLQNIVSVKAYLVLEVYQKYRPAEELISMLATIARKPKSLAEQIQEADTETMIKKIEKQDSEQKAWFQALLNTQILKDKKAIKCAKTWAHLSTADDVSRLLNLSVNSEDQLAKDLVIKCASVLSKADLIIVTTRYLYMNGCQHILNEEVNQQLVILFNKIGNNSNVDEDLVKDIVLLLLQNPKSVLKYLYKECEKNPYYTSFLRQCFTDIKEIADIENIGLTTFNEIFDITTLCEQNLKSYTILLNTFHDIKFFSNDVILVKILFRRLYREMEQESLESINNILQLINSVNIKIFVKEQTKDVILSLFKLMSKQRCKFLDFNVMKQENVRIICEILRNKCEVNLNARFIVDLIEEPDNFVSYYEEMLSIGIWRSLLMHLHPQFNIDNYAECVTKLIQILPCCVASEWISICVEIQNRCGHEKTIELLTDVLLLIGQVVESQKGANDDILQPIQSALKYCVHQYGSILQNSMVTQDNIQFEACVAKNICRLLKKFPECCKLEQGMVLINIIPERCLKSLANNKEFVCQLVTINNTELCKVIARKMTV